MDEDRGTQERKTTLNFLIFRLSPLVNFHCEPYNSNAIRDTPVVLLDMSNCVSRDATDKIWAQSALWLQRRCRLNVLTDTDRRRRRRTTAYPISFPGAFGSGELKLWLMQDYSRNISNGYNQRMTIFAFFFYWFSLLVTFLYAP